jgi:hypothetical protein
LVISVKKINLFPFSVYKVHRREEWKALVPKTLPKFDRIMNWNIIGHTAGLNIFNNEGCSDLVSIFTKKNLFQKYNKLF